MGGVPNRLPEEATPLTYHGVIRAALRKLAIYYLGNFYNFLVMKPERTDAEQQMVDVLLEALPRWQALADTVTVPSSPDEAVDTSAPAVLAVTNSHVIQQPTSLATPEPPSAQKQTNHL